MAYIGIDSTQYERTAPQGGPLPPGVYTMTVVRVQQKETNDKTGVYEEVEFDISQPTQFSNRKFWDRFNIINKSVVATRIGKEAIADLAKACGIHGLLNYEGELLGKTVQARLIVKPSNNLKYPKPKNECRKYYPVGVDADAEDKKGKGAVVTVQATATANPSWNTAGTPPVQAETVATPSSAAPWLKK
jgi:hypothetical protein